MAAAGRKRDIAIRVMVTAKEQAEIRKAANKAACRCRSMFAPRRLRRAVARGDLATAFHEAGHVAAAWSRGLKIHSATIDPTPGFRGHTLHANPWRGIRLNLSLARVRDRAKSAIVVYLAGPEAQQRHNPRSWRTHHGASDFKQAFDLAMGLSTSGEAAHAYLDWLTVVARDEIEALWPQVEKVAHALLRGRTLTARKSRTSCVAYGRTSGVGGQHFSDAAWLQNRHNLGHPFGSLDLLRGG